jgi:hypothetical protein
MFKVMLAAYIRSPRIPDTGFYFVKYLSNNPGVKNAEKYGLAALKPP